MVAREKDKSIQELITAIPNKVFKREALLVFVLLGAGAYGGWFIKEAHAAVEKEVVDAGVQPLKDDLDKHKADEAKRYEKLESELKELRHITTDKEARDAARFDVIYSTIATGRRDPRAEDLSIPAPARKDGGQ